VVSLSCDLSHLGVIKGPNNMQFESTGAKIFAALVTSNIFRFLGWQVSLQFLIGTVIQGYLWGEM